jgi:hypothetical protein
MSFSRIKYDNEAYDLHVNRSTAPGDYRLYINNAENCDKCFSYDGPRNSKSDISLPHSDSTNQWSGMAEVESYLTNRVNKLTDYNNYGKNDEYKNIKTQDKSLCNSVLAAEETRFTNPLESYRCMDTTAYKYSPFLYIDPQCEMQDDRIGLNSRQKIRDTHKINKPIPKDQSVFLPPHYEDFN